MKTQEMLGYVRNEWSHALHGLSDQWHNVRRKSNGALVQFKTPQASEEVQGNGHDLNNEWALLPADMVEAEDQLLVRMEIPGLNVDELQVFIDENELVIRGEKNNRLGGEAASNGGGQYLSEIVYGAFERRIPLPARKLSEEKNDAFYVDGVLSITLPFIMSKRPEPRVITVQ